MVKCWVNKSEFKVYNITSDGIELINSGIAFDEHGNYSNEINEVIMVTDIDLSNIIVSPDSYESLLHELYITNKMGKLVGDTEFLSGKSLAICKAIHDKEFNSL